MPSEIEQQLKAHITAIAQLLHTDAKAKGMPMASLGDIEQTVRAQIQTHVSPEIGHFLSKQIAQNRATPPDASPVS